ncbi:MAG: UDP-glucuronic acid decarboxylase family protein [Chlamydiota bacterium]|nr:UDP-glucuronic acid decarboxylase family protein [Chlamydiota bacterium]
MKKFACYMLLSVCFNLNHLEAKEANIKHALVAGGAGFLGSHLCERLLHEGYEVTCLDNLLTGHKKNISTFLNNPLFHYIEQDICNLNIPEEHYDEIYNLACPASPKRYQADPLHTLDTNYVGTLNLLKLANKCNAIFFQASTSEIYGNPSVHPQDEIYSGNVNPIGVRACYDEGKRVAETLCFEFHRQHNLQIKVARIFNTYGPKMSPDDGRVVSTFINQALEGQDITVHGDGSQTRSYCYVDDLIDGFRKFMNTEKEITGPMNLGNPTELTVLELAEMIISLTDSSSSIVFHKLPQDDPTRRKPNISLAEKSCGWNPNISLREGLKRAIEYFSMIKEDNQ